MEPVTKEYDSILLSVKKALDIDPSYHHFDPDVIMTINSVFGILHQLGVGPKDEPFEITGEDETWQQFSSDKRVRLVRSYMYLKVKQIFDPPTVSTMFEAMTKQIEEMEWRLNVAVDPPDTMVEE